LTYLRRVLVLCETSRSGHDALAPARARRVRGRITGSPCYRTNRQERQRPPRFRVLLLLVAVVKHPAACGSSPRPCRGHPPWPKHGAGAARHGGWILFRGWLPTAPRSRTHASPRAPVSRTCVARLTTDLPGSALVGRVSHPLEDSLNLMSSSQPTPFRPAFPGRTQGRRRRLSLLV
jgi:hypothetical protein